MGSLKPHVCGNSSRGSSLHRPEWVLDVGGGPGRYSCWLAENGYEVHLIDPVEKHVKQAREASESQPCHPLASVTQGDARSLNHGDGSADAALLMCPLYHLTARDHRLAALREAHRVLKPGGLLVAKAISRFASLLDGLSKGFIDDPNFVPLLRYAIEEGQHSGYPGYFTTAFFHRPEELEGRMSDPTKRTQLLDLIRTVEQEKTLLGVSSHFVIVATK